MSTIRMRHNPTLSSQLSLVLLAALLFNLPCVVALADDQPAFDWSTVDSQSEKSAYIGQQLREWRKPASTGGKKLRVVYFHPKDRKPLTDHVERWHRIMADIQQFYRDEMRRLGYGDVTLALEIENEKLKLHEVQGEANDDGSYSYRTGGRIYGEVVKALAKKGIDANAETLLIVCGLSRTEDKKVTIYSPYYGMGADHNKGICFVADSDWLTIDGLKPDDKGITLQVKEHRGFEPFTLARFNTTYIGGTIHELGHGLSLPHNHATKQEAERGTALMGAGNYTYRQEWRNEGKGSFLTHAHAIRLLMHPLFSGTTQQSSEPPNLRLPQLSVSFREGQIHLRGTIQADVPAVAMIVYNDGENKNQKGYQVNNDYDATTWTSVVSPQNEFWLRVGDLKDGNHQLRLASVHANGAVVVNRLHYTTKDGVPNFTQTNKEIAKITTHAAGIIEVPAIDQQRVHRSEHWTESRFRFAKSASLHTDTDKAALEFEFDGTAVAVRLGGHNVSAYGPANLGTIVATVDDRDELVFDPRSTPREITLAQGLSPGKHKVRLEHRRDGDLAGCRVESLRTWSEPCGELQFVVTGEENAHLVDCRAILRCGETIVRDTLVRNWLTGQCSLTGIPTGDDYSLELRATGWVTARTDKFRVDAEAATTLKPIFLRRDASTVAHRFRFPRLNQPAIRRAGETFRVRFLGFDATIDEVKLTRSLALPSRAGLATTTDISSALESQATTISRVVSFKEDESAAYYYDREVVVELPDDMPPGVYDLSVQVTGGRRTGICRSPRSVHILKEFPTDPVFVTFGHLDTSGQYQSEYLERLVSVINILGPDMVLCSNACNPAYVSGALASLDMPYVTNFGNHQFPGHEAWYGDPVGLVDLGPHVSVLNFGYPWHTDKSKAKALLASRTNTPIRVINAFEANAPFSLLDKHQVRMIHDAHGIGKKVMDLGATPTRRIGKTNSESFRVVRFKDNRVESCTYNGHETAPIPFPRESTPPLSVSFLHPNDGTQSTNTATVTNQLAEAYSNGRITFVVPAGKYKVEGGRLESQVLSDDGRFQVVSVRVNIPALGSAVIKVSQAAPNRE